MGRGWLRVGGEANPYSSWVHISTHQSFLHCTLSPAIHFNGSNGTAYNRASNGPKQYYFAQNVHFVSLHGPHSPLWVGNVYMYPWGIYWPYHKQKKLFIPILICLTSADWFEWQYRLAPTRHHTRSRENTQSPRCEKMKRRPLLVTCSLSQKF
jgi:hypothetical protein